MVMVSSLYSFVQATMVELIPEDLDLQVLFIHPFYLCKLVKEAVIKFRYTDIIFIDGGGGKQNTQENTYQT
jgi:hypothetical protein